MGLFPFLADPVAADEITADADVAADIRYSPGGCPIGRFAKAAP